MPDAPAMLEADALRPTQGLEKIHLPFPAEQQAHDVERPGWRLPLHLDRNRAVPIDPQTELCCFSGDNPRHRDYRTAGRSSATEGRLADHQVRHAWR
jgi:hypothetical protein